MALVRQAKEVYVAKGKNVVHFNFKNETPTDGELAKLVLGPTGNLRAPTLRKGKTLLIGFNEATYQKVFSGRAS